MPTLLHRLQRAAADGTSGLSYSADLTVHAGLDTETDPARYVWDGLRRGADPAHPFVVFQYTLAGWGRYAADGLTHLVTPGMAFAAVIPSAHVYSLPPDSPSWTFFFLILRHPYVVGRIWQAQAEVGPLLTLAEGSALLARAVSLYEGTLTRAFRDTWALEAALFDFLFEYERLAQRLRYPEAEREALLDDVARYVRSQAGRPVGVAELAAVRGQSRSHFSRGFKAATGIAPASWGRQVQLEEAARRLLAGDHKLEVIASETGFANANHLCKVFRRHYHLSPGEFRRQMR